MNKTKIEWCSHTWNPVTGCWGPGGTAEKPNRCPYCYALKLNQRFGRPFAPTFHPDRLSQPEKVKKPSRIFVCSMADLSGDWVPREWIMQVLWCVLASPHTFQFLTKNPKRLQEFNPWPRNAWVGTTVTNQADADERLPWLIQVDARVRFVSHEPLLGPIDETRWISCYRPDVAKRKGEFRYIASAPKTPTIQWAIIGAMTGPGAVKPQISWVLDLMKQYQAAGVPVFLKENLRGVMGWTPDSIIPWPQEFPE